MNREELLAKFADPIRVLDDGFIRLVDVMGDDSSIVQAARISYGAGTKSVSDDRTLIRYLLRHRHTTPFEACSIKIHWRAPIDVIRQAQRHRSASLIFDDAGMFSEPSVNEYSTRYSEAIDSAQKTDPGKWRLQSKSNKQGSSGYVTEWPDGFDPFEVAEILEPCSPGHLLSYSERDLQSQARAVYEQRLKFGVAREQARKDLPLSTYSEMFWIQDLFNFFHFSLLRLDPHAQEEIRAYAVAADQIAADWVPEAHSAFESYMRYAVTFSREELQILSELMQKSWNHNFDLGGWLMDRGAAFGMSKREIKEFACKVHFKVRPILADEHELLR